MGKVRWRVLLQSEGNIEKYGKAGDREITRFARLLSRPRNGVYPILISSALAYGDALMLGPALEALRARFVNSPIHLLTTTRGGLMFCYDPAVTAVIGGPLRKKNIVRRIELCYLHSYVMGDWLTINPDALWKNNYEVAFDKLFVTPGTVRPRFYYSPEEEASVRKALVSLGIEPENDKIALVHSESSSMMRRWPLEHVFSLAQALSSKGLTVVVAGTKLLQQCPEPPSIPRVMYTCRELAGLSTRETFLLTKYATLVIAVDSVYSHLTAAFQKPAVLIYGAFRPELSAAPYCPLAHVLQHDMPCGPCHVHRGLCVIEPRAYAAPCMQAITPDEVLEAVDALLEGRTPRETVRARKELDGIERRCPVCHGRSSELMARKGDMFYSSCSFCGTLFRPCDESSSGLFAEQEPHPGSAQFAGELLPPLEAVSHVRATVSGLLDGFGPRMGLIVGMGLDTELCKLLRQDGWKCCVYDPACGALRAGPYATTEPCEGKDSGQAPENGPRYAAVFVIGQVTRILTMERLWTLLGGTVALGGLAIIAGPVAEYCSYKEAPSLNTRQLGQSIVIPSIRGLNMGAERRGFVMEYSSRVWSTPWEIMIWRRRRGEMATVDGPGISASIGGEAP